MNPLRTHPFGLGAAAATASLAVAGALLVGPAGTGQAAGAGHHDARTGTHAVTARQLALHDHMRKLWEDHVTWTRLAIVTFADGSAGFGATARRLLRNQQDIGRVFGRFYGDRKGDHLASLLHDHITIAVELLQAAKAGDQAAVTDASNRWYANARDIADFLSGLNHRAWPRAEMRSMMKTHLDETLKEAVDRLNGRFDADIRDYDAVHRSILEMADMLSDGIVAQFPSRFR
jgi:hypothetical protein